MKYLKVHNQIIVELTLCPKVNPKDYIVLIAGANDVYNGQEINANNFKPSQLTLKQSRTILAGIPFI